MTRRLGLLALFAASTAAAQPAPLTWGTDEPAHARLLRQGLAGKALGALESVLASDGFHVVRTHLAMAGTAIPSLRQGTLTIVYEDSPPASPCPPGAPCRQEKAAQVLVVISCDQRVAPGAKVADSCDGMRGVQLVPQP